MRSWLLQFVLCWFLALVHVSDAATTHKKRATDCGADKFKCMSGSCVPSSSVCNKKHDCNDGSDEAPALCGNGTNSDRSCLYPPNIENGQYMDIGCESCTADPGKPIQDGSVILQYTCNAGYTLKDGSTNILFCRNGQWNSNPPTCEQFSVKCPKLTSESIVAECSHGQSRFTCDWPVAPGTKAILRCKAYYVSATPTQSLTCGLDGQWNNVVMKCTPACGKDRSGNNPLIAHGTRLNGGDFPWHVGIFKNVDGVYVNICGGSLISLRYILSAAHCFWDNEKSEKYPENLYKVVAGKFHRSYTTIDPGQEEQTIKTIDIPPLFSGSNTYYRDDIAVLTMSEPFQLGENIRPVCVDWDDYYELAPGDMGHIAGWGLTEKREPSEELRSAVIPVIDIRQCIKETKANYQNYFGSDKICAGYKNGTSVCIGDNGGGLTFVHEINPTGISNKAFFVHGIVSTTGGTSLTNTCNLEDYVAITKVSRFRVFLAKYRPY